MPHYFPDLESVKSEAELHATKQKPENKYKGIIPQNEEELPQARKELGQYMRDVWGDEISALEIELGVDINNYDEKIREYLEDKFEP